MGEYIPYEMLISFAFNLRKRMKILDLKQNDLAMMTNISEATISRYLNNLIFPSDENLIRISHVLNCDIDELLIPMCDEINQEESNWITIKKHPNYEINSDFEIRNKKTGRILKNQLDDKDRLIIRIDGQTEKVLNLYDKAFGTDEVWPM